MSKQLKIERVNPTDGRVWSLDINGIMQPVLIDGSYVATYGKCVDYINKNQTDLKAYKIARILHRKNAKRRTLSTVYLMNNHDAVQYFGQLVFQGPDAKYQLLTGDWKLIAEKTVINNVQGQTIII